MCPSCHQSEPGEAKTHAVESIPVEAVTLASSMCHSPASCIHREGYESVDERRAIGFEDVPFC